MTGRLLIVDDEPPIRYALRDYFSAADYEVDCAGSYDEAVAALDARRYDGVIADLRLDEGDEARGLDVVRIARARNRTGTIVVLSAHGSAEMAAEARRRGADAFLDKPVPLPAIARLLAGAGTADEPPPRAG